MCRGPRFYRWYHVQTAGDQFISNEINQEHDDNTIDVGFFWHMSMKLASNNKN